MSLSAESTPQREGRSGLHQRSDVEGNTVTTSLFGRLSTIVTHVLRAPLVLKIIGSNLLVFATMSGVAMAIGWRLTSDREVVWWASALVLGMLATVTLVFVALRPLRDLESTARRVSSGDLTARVPPSRLADRSITRIGETLNDVLDGLITDRNHMRALASSVISAHDKERARIELALHDSTAQTFAAISWELGALARDAEESMKPRLARVKEHVEQALQDVRLLAHTVHPRVLDDLGLSAALAQLAREGREMSGLNIVVDSDSEATKALAPAEAAALFRVAKEAVANAMKHASATQVTLVLRKLGDATVLEVSDDGGGFNVMAAERRRGTTGLFTMREHVSLVGGNLDIESAPLKGTRVRVHVPNPSLPSGSNA